MVLFLQLLSAVFLTHPTHNLSSALHIAVFMLLCTWGLAMALVRILAALRKDFGEPTSSSHTVVVY